jgi:hypothetical protein
MNCIARGLICLLHVVMIFHADFGELHLRLINTIYHENTKKTYLLPYTEALT